jgi:uncharacterized alpha-E superfamily protein
LPNLIARFADNAFWLGRYLERAENLARIILTNTTYARHDAGAQGWQHIVELFSDQKRFAENYEDFAAKSVLSFYILDKGNFSSLVSTVAAARESARSLRHLISTEMWTHLNMFHSTMQALTQNDIRGEQLGRTMSKIITGCQTFEGIAEGTFIRGETCIFYQIGKYLERADQTTRILDMGYGRLGFDEDDAITSAQWHVLLRSVSGYHAFRSRHPGPINPKQIATFLLYDNEFPRAVNLCVSRFTQQLRNLQERTEKVDDKTVEDARRELEFLLDTGPGVKVTPSGLHRYLDQIQRHIGKLANSLRTCCSGVTF